MNSNRKAELQRKLASGAVPKPPAGLAERIKADIPKDLSATRHRPWPARASGPMRLAASIMIVITSLVVGMYVAAPENDRKSAAPETAASRPVIFAPAPRAVSSETIAPTTAAARSESVSLDAAEEAEAPTLPTQIVQSAPSREDDAVESTMDMAAERDAQALTGAYAAESVGTEAAPAQIAEARPSLDSALAVPAEAAPAPAAPPPPPAERRSAGAVAAAAPAPESSAASLAVSQRKQARNKLEAAADRDVFGITVDPEVFQNIRATLASGRKPAASEVDVEAVVNYFTPARPPRNGVRLEVEASPTVIEVPGDHAVLRFSVDTPATRDGALGSDARIEVVFNDDVVRTARRFGDGGALAPEPALLPGTSVTGLYALELRSGLRASDTVATVRLHYVTGGNPETVTRTVLGRDLAGSWQKSSRRHRLATLGAMWAEGLKGAAKDGEIARRARDLATQDPGDVLARELARAATATEAGGR